MSYYPQKRFQSYPQLIFMTLTTRLAVSPPPHSHESLVMAASKGRASNGNYGNTRPAYVKIAIYMNGILMGKSLGYYPYYLVFHMVFLGMICWDNSG